MAKSGTLIPTLKTKKRYIAYEVISDKPISKKEFTISFLAKAKEIFGDFGLADLEVIFLKHSGSKGFFKVKNGFVDKAKTILTMIEKIEKMDVIVRSLNTSGTIKKVI